MKIPDTVPWVSVGRTLGSGGQAIVELVKNRDPGDPRQYALKVLKNVESQEAMARFAREIEAVKKLDSPFVAKIIDHSKPEESFQYYTMEYYDGAKTLASIIFSNSNPFHANVLKCLDIFEKLVWAIQKCEQADPRIVHRDIAPKNILVLPNESIRLIDFGVCLIESGERVTLVDEDVGSRNYAAPECEAGNESEIGVQSDIYSAAKVLWSAITGERAFAREKPVFGIKGMFSMFASVPMTYHLNSIFEMTIRVNPENRCRDTNALLRLIREIRYLVEHGYPPLEEVAKRCPSCGRLDIVPFTGGHNVFGNPNPAGVESCICNTCGFGFVRDMGLLRGHLQLLKNLE